MTHTREPECPKCGFKAYWQYSTHSYHGDGWLDDSFTSDSYTETTSFMCRNCGTKWIHERFYELTEVTNKEK